MVCGTVDLTKQEFWSIIKITLMRLSESYNLQQASIAPPVPGKRRGQTWSLWQIDTHFCVKVLRAGNVTGVQGDKKVGLSLAELLRK